MQLAQLDYINLGNEECQRAQGLPLVEPDALGATNWMPAAALFKPLRSLTNSLIWRLTFSMV
jgi:hypothetical protein